MCGGSLWDISVQEKSCFPAQAQDLQWLSPRFHEESLGGSACWVFAHLSGVL